MNNGTLCAPALARAGLLWGLMGLCALSACSNTLPGPFLDPLPQDLGTPDLIPIKTHLIIEPAMLPPIVLFSGTPETPGTRERRDFKAFRVNEGTGEKTDVTDVCFWSVQQRSGQRLSLGSIDHGHFVSAAEVAGTGVVDAELADLRSSVSILVQLKGAIHLAKTLDGTDPPADAARYFKGATSAPRAPSILYPPDGSVIPQNLNELEVQYGAQGDDVFEVFLSSTLLDLHIYTGSLQRLSLSSQEYTLLTDAGNTGPITLLVRGASKADPSTYGESSPVRLRVTPPVVGATYYFSTVIPGQGIWRYDWLSSPGGRARAYATDQTSSQSGQCFGCHSLSRDGRILTASLSMIALGSGAIIDVQNGGRKSVQGGKWSFSSVASAGDQAAVSGGGALALLLVEQGTLGTALVSGGGALLSQPNLSQDGNLLVYVQGQPVAGKSEAHVQNGSLRTLTKANGFGVPTDLLLTQGAQNNYYPAITPDGQWVLFTRANGDSFDNPGAQLFAVAADGKSAAFPLTSANSVLSTKNNAVLGYLTNSYPSFLPLPVTTAGQPLYYFTFSSRREVGVEISHTGATPAAGTTVVLTPNTAKTTMSGWNDQIWLSTFDPGKAKMGQDPSSPAIWLPLQSPTSSNHTAASAQTFFNMDL